MEVPGPESKLASADEAPSGEEMLATLDHLRGKAGRGRLLFIGAFVAIIVGFIILTVYLEMERREADAARRVAVDASREANVARDRAVRERNAVVTAYREAASAMLSPEIDRDKTIEALQFAAETAAAGTVPQVPLNRLSVTSFFCEESPSANADHARALSAARPAGASAQWGAEPLSVEDNARWNYQLTSNEIRYNPEEENAARQLLAQIRTLGGNANLVLSFFPSPGKVSVFFCNGATPPSA